VGVTVTSLPSDPWWQVFPALETWVPCGPDLHPVRFQDGRLSLPAHPDAEAELVFAALSGEKACCIEVAAAWHQHADDLRVLALGPRGPSDAVNISWDDIQDFRSRPVTKYARPSGLRGRGVFRTQPMRPGPPAQPGPPVRPNPPVRPGPPAQPGPPVRPVSPVHVNPPMRPGPPGLPRVPGMVPGRGPGEPEPVQAERLEMLLLLALGPAFQMLLSGLVAAAWSDGGARASDRPYHRPALEAALTGRLAAVAAPWLGISPDQVDARLHEGTGWGRLEPAGSGLRASLPAGWLATVWAGGLAVVDGLLVVAVQRAAWPEATVLAVPEPGRDPVVLKIRADEDASTAGDRAHWEVTDRRARGAGHGRAGPSGGEAGRP
jgi:hypothetical protein